MQTLLLGDSLTAWNDWDNVLGEHANHGVPGDTIDALLRRLRPLLTPQPERVILMIGTNDLLQGIPFKVIQERYTQLLHALLDIESLYILSVIPVIDQPHTTAINENILTLNHWLREQGWKYGFTYIDLHSQLRDGKGLKTAYTNDGIHLTEAGYNVWEEVLGEALEA